MSNLGATFGAGEFKDDYAPITPGQYKLAVTNTEMKTSGANAKIPGIQYLRIEFSIQGGENDGRKIFQNLNIHHPDAQTKKIAQVELEKICAAIGKVVSSHEDLRGCTLLGDVIVEPSSNPQYQDSNRVKKYYPLGTGPVPLPSAPQAGPWAK